MSILGTRVVRREDPLFLTQGATYTDDLTDDQLIGALHVTLVRSTAAHARVITVDASAALEAPGVVAVVTGADLADLAPLPHAPQHDRRAALRRCLRRPSGSGRVRGGWRCRL